MADSRWLPGLGTFVGIAASVGGATGVGAPVGVALGITAGIAGVVSVASGIAAAAGLADMRTKEERYELYREIAIISGTFGIAMGAFGMLIRCCSPSLLGDMRNRRW